MTKYDLPDGGWSADVELATQAWKKAAEPVSKLLDICNADWRMRYGLKRMEFGCIVQCDSLFFVRLSKGVKNLEDEVSRLREENARLRAAFSNQPRICEILDYFVKISKLMEKDQ